MSVFPTTTPNWPLNSHASQANFIDAARYTLYSAIVGRVRPAR